MEAARRAQEKEAAEQALAAEIATRRKAEEVALARAEAAREAFAKAEADALARAEAEREARALAESEVLAKTTALRQAREEAARLAVEQKGAEVQAAADDEEREHLIRETETAASAVINPATNFPVEDSVLVTATAVSGSSSIESNDVTDAAAVADHPSPERATAAAADFRAAEVVRSAAKELLADLESGGCDVGERSSECEVHESVPQSHVSEPIEAPAPRDLLGQKTHSRNSSLDLLDNGEFSTESPLGGITSGTATPLGVRRARSERQSSILAEKLSSLLDESLAAAQMHSTQATAHAAAAEEEAAAAAEASRSRTASRIKDAAEADAIAAAAMHIAEADAMSAALINRETASPPRFKSTEDEAENNFGRTPAAARSALSESVSLQLSSPPPQLTLCVIRPPECHITLCAYAPPQRASHESGFGILDNKLSILRTARITVGLR